MNEESHKSELSDRDLYYDGSSVWNADALLTRILNGLDATNTFTKTETKGFKTKTTCDILERPMSAIPKEYQDIDLDYLFHELCKNKSPEAIKRNEYELVLYRERGFEDVLYLMCYITDYLTKNNIVWGVGRGSSVASYLLYLLGIHLIDPIKYGLDIHDFIRDK